MHGRLKQHRNRFGKPRQRMSSAELEKIIKRAITREKKISRVVPTLQRVRSLRKG